jgi:hypothetical protein
MREVAEPLGVDVSGQDFICVGTRDVILSKQGSVVVGVSFCDTQLLLTKQGQSCLTSEVRASYVNASVYERLAKLLV